MEFAKDSSVKEIGKNERYVSANLLQRYFRERNLKKYSVADHFNHVKRFKIVNGKMFPATKRNESFIRIYWSSRKDNKPISRVKKYAGRETILANEKEITIIIDSILTKALHNESSERIDIERIYIDKDFVVIPSELISDVVEVVESHKEQSLVRSSAAIAALSETTEDYAVITTKGQFTWFQST